MFKSIVVFVVLAAFVSANILPSKDAKVNPTACKACEYAVQYLENQIESNTTVSEIITAIEKVCDYAPASTKDTCDALIEQYGPQIITMLINKATPEMVCHDLSVC